MIAPSLQQRRNFCTEPARKVFAMFPRVLKSPNRCADEIGRGLRNPQILIKNKNIILL